METVLILVTTFKKLNNMHSTPLSKLLNFLLKGIFSIHNCPGQSINPFNSMQCYFLHPSKKSFIPAIILSAICC